MYQDYLYMKMIKKVSGFVEWMIFTDLDEFIVPKKHPSLKSFLQEHEMCPAIFSNFLFFGTGDVEEIPNNRLMIETLTRCDDVSSFNQKHHWHTRPIVKPRYVESSCWLDLKLKDGFFYYDSCKRPWRDMGKGIYKEVYTTENLQTNHYWSKDDVFFRNVKLKRPHMKLADKEKAKDWAYRQFVQKEDDAILRFVPDVRQSMGFKDEDEGRRPSRLLCES
jgi:hypothetical protein